MNTDKKNDIFEMKPFSMTRPEKAVFLIVFLLIGILYEQNVVEFGGSGRGPAVSLFYWYLTCIPYIFFFGAGIAMIAILLIPHLLVSYIVSKMTSKIGSAVFRNHR